MPEEPEVAAQEPSEMDDAQLAEAVAEPEEAGETVSVPEPEPAEKPEGEPAPEEPPKPTVEELLSRVEKAEKRATDQEAFIQRQSNELGRLRQMAAQQIPQIDPVRAREDIRQTFEQDPVAAYHKLRYIEQHNEAVRREQTRAAIPDLGDLLDDMGEVAATQLGETKETVQAFKQDPFRVPLPLLNELAIRARNLRAEKAEADKKRMAEEELSKRAAAKAAATKTTTSITGSTGGRTSGKDSKGFARVSPDHIATMSDEELKAFISQDK